MRAGHDVLVHESVLLVVAVVLVLCAFQSACALESLEGAAVGVAALSRTDGDVHWLGLVPGEHGAQGMCECALRHRQGNYALVFTYAKQCSSLHMCRPQPLGGVNPDPAEGGAGCSASVGCAECAQGRDGPGRGSLPCSIRISYAVS